MLKVNPLTEKQGEQIGARKANGTAKPRKVTKKGKSHLRMEQRACPGEDGMVVGRGGCLDCPQGTAMKVADATQGRRNTSSRKRKDCRRKGPMASCIEARA